MSQRYVWARQLTALAVLLAVWEATGRAGLLNPHVWSERFQARINIAKGRFNQCAGFGGATASAIDFNSRPRSLLVEMTAVVSFSNATRITSRLRRKE